MPKEIKYLGVKITQDCIKTDTQKIEANISMSSHKNCKQVAKVSGMITWLSN